MSRFKSNPYTLSFGLIPPEYISRVTEKDKIIKQIQSIPPLSHCFITTGVRGSGKTVMLTSISKTFENKDDWIVIELNPEDDLREALVAKLYTSAKIKHLFLEKNFNFSFQGFSFSLIGKNPVLNVDDLLEKMLDAIKKQRKKVLVLIDEVTNNEEMKKFSLSFQILIRKEASLFLLATGLYENRSALENEKNLTFLIRSPKTFLSPLNITSIAPSYEKTIGLSTNEEAMKCAKLTKGYAFSFQLSGYLLFEDKSKTLDKKVLNALDQYLAEYVYQKIWDSLTNIEKKIVSNFDSNSSKPIKEILDNNSMSKQYFSRYRDRLLKKGIFVSPSRGRLSFALPRFKEFIDNNKIYE